MVEPKLFRPVESLIRRQFQTSSRAQAVLARLEGKTLAVKFRGGPWQVYACVQGGELSINTGYAGKPDVVVEGSLLSLARFSLAADPRTLAAEGVSISGDGETAQDFLELSRLARPDLEEELSRLVGDVLAHQIGNAARDTIRWGSNAGATMAANLKEFLQEESRDLPTNIEVHEFLDDVDSLSQDVARCEARLKKLEERR